MVVLGTITPIGGHYNVRNALKGHQSIPLSDALIVDKLMWKLIRFTKICNVTRGHVNGLTRPYIQNSLAGTSNNSRKHKLKGKIYRSHAYF